jgi:hypothetical protein
MEAVKATGTINKQGQLTLDQPLNLPENSRVEIIVLVQDALPNGRGDAEEDLSKEELLADFRQAWHEAMTGQTIPAEQLWDEALQDAITPKQERQTALSQLLDSWMEDKDENEQAEAWKYLQKALDEDRLSNRPFFP